MKLSYKTMSRIALVAVCALTMGVTTSCNDDDDTIDDIIINEPPTGPSISVADSDYWVKIGETVAIAVTDGGGDYKAFALNPEFVEVSCEGSNVNVKAIANGATEVVITDANGKVLQVPVVAYTTKELAFEATTFNATTLLGYSETVTTKVTQGNGGYSLVATTVPGENNVYVNYETGEITFTVASRLNPIDYTITVKDVIGIEGVLNVKVSANFDPFPTDYVDMLKAQTSNYCQFNVAGISETDQYWFRSFSANPQYSAWFVNSTDVERSNYDGTPFITLGQYVCGWSMANGYEDYGGVLMASADEFNTSSDVTASFMFKYSNNEWWPYSYRTGGEGRILVDDDTKTVFVWSKRNEAEQHYDRAAWVYIK